jgi:hypothetical protein
LVIEGKPTQKPEITDQVKMDLYRLYQQGTGAREAVARLSETSGVSKNELYQAWLRLAKGE